MSDKTMKNGKIGVQSDNMFPIIKKFLYSDNEIFLREIVSNAVDATQKLRTLASKGEYSGPMDDLKVEVKIDGDKLIISDKGVGMSADEIEKYINQIAISGAEEFVQKYKDDAASIIGHFGLGFYSSFMVSRKVEIYTQSYREEEDSIRWICEGNPEFTMEVAEKRPRGTDIILYIDEESKEFLEPTRIRQLLEKYAKFLPVPIVFGKEKEWKDGKEMETDKDLVINATEPLWIKMPSELEDKQYEDFYQMLYPMSEKPLFWIHLNIDYPFNLTGILYFPRVKSNMDLQKNKIQLYSNQVFVTDSVEGIVPDFLMLLHGVIDSPDIPLNVSRSYLQADHNVKKISSYITRKVADKLAELFKDDRVTYEEKWEVLDLFVKYGMLTDEKFYEKAEKFALLKNTQKKYYTLAEYRDLISSEQTDKDGHVVYLYAVDLEKQYSYIKAANNRGYDVLLMDGQLDIHVISMLEQKVAQSHFVRVDSDTIDNLIKKDSTMGDHAEVSEEDKRLLEHLFEQQLPKEDKVMLSVQTSHQGKDAKPLVLVQGEYMRRMKDMAAMQQGMNFYGELPDSYVVNLNLDHPVVRGIAVVFNETESEDYKALQADHRGQEARVAAIHQQLDDDKLSDEEKKTLRDDLSATNDKISEIDEKLSEVYKTFGNNHKVISQLIDLGLLSSGLLKGEALDSFITRSMDFLSEK
ncbi:Chaperone protein HtpG [Porphyromonas levii]|nr:Chaperone protein HtpG [Porphyromonas levii]MBR8763741.1 Chaperone protein HtpG [Porphyromonas levii]MBR8770308.1 Chaperone protein HtpG [Porphyromonas levii]